MALVKLYPELMLKKGKFLKFKKGWEAQRKQRKFFDKLAKSKKFDPSDSNKWYSITCDDIKRAGGRDLLNYYNRSRRSHIEALVKLYPELRLKKGNFLKLKNLKGWKEPGKQRKFFDEFARSKKFDPLDADKWFSVSHYDIRKAGGSHLLYQYYNGSHIKALVKAYPELMLKKENFWKSKQREEHDEEEEEEEEQEEQEEPEK